MMRCQNGHLVYWSRWVEVTVQCGDNTHTMASRPTMGDFSVIGPSACPGTAAVLARIGSPLSSNLTTSLARESTLCGIPFSKREGQPAKVISAGWPCVGVGKFFVWFDCGACLGYVWVKRTQLQRKGVWCVPAAHTILRGNPKLVQMTACPRD